MPERVFVAKKAVFSCMAAAQKEHDAGVRVQMRRRGLALGMMCVRGGCVRRMPPGSCECVSCHPHLSEVSSPESFERVRVRLAACVLLGGIACWAFCLARRFAFAAFEVRRDSVLIFLLSRRVARVFA